LDTDIEPKSAGASEPILLPGSSGHCRFPEPPDLDAVSEHADAVRSVRWRIDPIRPKCIHDPIDEIIDDLLDVASWLIRLGLTYTAFYIPLVYLAECSGPFFA